MVSILTNKDAYPTLSRTFDVAAAFHSAIEVLHDLENILGDGHTRLYNTIRDLVIKKWGRSFVGLGAKTFGLTPRRIGQILGDKGDNEKKLLEVINANHDKFALERKIHKHGSISLTMSLSRKVAKSRRPCGAGGKKWNFMSYLSRDGMPSA